MKSSIRLLITIPSVAALYGGPSKSVRELAQALGRQGTSVDFVTTNANGTEVLDVPLQTWVEETYYRLQYFSCNIWGDYKWSFPLARWLKANLHHYDIVHINAVFSLTNLPFYWYCRCQQVPYMVAPRGMLEPWAIAYKSNKKRMYYQLFERRALQQASAIQALASPEAKNIYTLGLNTPIITISNGIHRQDFERLEDPNLFYRYFPKTRGKTLLLFLGRIDPKKGLDLLASAFAKVLTQYPNTHLVIAGPDNVGFLSTAKQYFQKAGCLQSVMFTGLLTGNLKYSALAAADLYIAPSYSEGFSMSVLEGMASGLPCIITTGCNFPEADRANAVRTVDISDAAITKALLECLSDLPAAKAMGQRARQFVLENYTWDRIATQLVDVYTAILAEQHFP